MIALYALLIMTSREATKVPTDERTNQRFAPQVIASACVHRTGEEGHRLPSRGSKTHLACGKHHFFHIPLSGTRGRRHFLLLNHQFPWIAAKIAG